MAINDVNVKDKVDIKGDGEGGGEICGIDLYPQAHSRTGPHRHHHRLGATGLKFLKCANGRLPQALRIHPDWLYMDFC